MREYEQSFLTLLPPELRPGPEEPRLAVIISSFLKSLDRRGDICDFGCADGMMSIRLAFVLRALHVPKTVFSFDEFDRRHAQDNQSKAEVDDDVYRNLKAWSGVLPIRPIRGDIRQTCKLLVGPLCFVSLNVTPGSLVENVLREIAPRCAADTTICINGAGHSPTTPLAIYVDRLTTWGQLIEIDRDAENSIRLFRFSRSALSW